LGDIDFKSLAKSPLVMQALQGLSRMPTNQAQFGDSMVTGFTRGMQQFGAEEQAKAKEQAAIDLEQERYNTEQERLAAASAIAAERQAYTRRKADRDFDWQVKKFKAEQAAKNLRGGSKLTEAEVVYITDWIEDDPSLSPLLENMSDKEIKKIGIEAASIFNNDVTGLGGNMLYSALEAIKRQRRGISPTSSQKDNNRDTVANAVRVDGKLLVKSK